MDPRHGPGIVRDPEWPSRACRHIGIERRLPTDDVVGVQLEDVATVENQQAQRWARAGLRDQGLLVHRDAADGAEPGVRIVEMTVLAVDAEDFRRRRKVAAVVFLVVLERQRRAYLGVVALPFAEEQQRLEWLRSVCPRRHAFRGRGPDRRGIGGHRLGGLASGLSEFSELSGL